MSLRFLRDGWYFQTIDATAATCEWCGASVDGSTVEVLEAGCAAHRRECPPRPRPWEQITVDPMVPKGYVEIRDGDGIVFRRRVVPS